MGNGSKSLSLQIKKLSGKSTGKIYDVNCKGASNCQYANAIAKMLAIANNKHTQSLWNDERYFLKT